MFKLAGTATLVAVTMLWAAALQAQQTPADSIRRQRTQDSLELARLREAAAAPADTATPPPQPQRSQNALNPEITVTGDLRGSAYRSGGGAANFSAREFEIGFQSVLDPYATAKIFAAFEDGEAVIEEGYVFFPALPGHLRLDLGAFRQDVGELNRWHLHALPEDEYPLVIRRFAGEEGLASVGASLYWPLPFSGRAGTYELTVQATTGSNEVLYLGGSRPAISSKLSAFWQLTRSSYVMASVSGAFGTNPDSSLKTRLMVAGARFTWRPPMQARSRELTVRGELWNLSRRVGGAGPVRRGWFADASWKLNRRWILGARYDRVQSPDSTVAGWEWAVTPAITFWQSEFVYVRGLWEHARDFAGAKTNRGTIQVVFAMGPHKHELF